MTTTMPGGAGAVILAAGAGSRMGLPKALLEFEGRLLVERAVETALAGGCADVTVVLGARADEVRQRAELGPARVVVNGDWAKGMGSSLRAGLTALTALEFLDAALVLLVDQPFVGPAAVRAVLDARRDGARLAAASYRGERGHPVSAPVPGQNSISVDWFRPEADIRCEHLDVSYRRKPAIADHAPGHRSWAESGPTNSQGKAGIQLIPEVPKGVQTD